MGTSHSPGLRRFQKKGANVDLFRTNGVTLMYLPPVTVGLEKEIQRLLESNLQEVFGVSLLASEFPISGDEADGRLDSLGLDENRAPVVIEYKRTTSVNIVVQSLHYLHWVCTHKGDVEALARERLGKEVAVDWTQPRALCVADSFSPYDVGAVAHLGPEVQLVEFKRFGPDLVLINTLGAGRKRRPGGRRTTGPKGGASHTVENLLSRAAGEMRAIAENLREHALGLGSDVSEAPTREYIAFRRVRNFCCLEPHKEHVLLHLRLDPKVGEGYPICTDVSSIGHFGTGDLRVRVSGPDDVETAKRFIVLAYGGLSGGASA
jgi:predicted transport protein